MGGWNKGIKNSTGTAFKGKKHSADTVDKLKSRPKEVYKNQNIVDNIRVLRQLGSDRLHQEMVNLQYKEK